MDTTTRSRRSFNGADEFVHPSGTEEVRAFLPSKDFEVSKAFYSALGFEKVLEEDVAIFQAGQSEFVLTRYFQQNYADNSMVQILVDDLDAWWSRIESLDLPAAFGVRAPRPPADQERAYGSRLSSTRAESSGISCSVRLACSAAKARFAASASALFHLAVCSSKDREHAR